MIKYLYRVGFAPKLVVLSLNMCINNLSVLVVSTMGLKIYANEV